MTGKELSIIVINWNAKSFLKDCLSSIFSVDLPFDTQVLVVDNASTDGSQDMVKSEFPQVKLIENNKNLGYSRAANCALRELYTKYSLLLNSDTKFFRDSIRLMVEFANEHSRVGALGPMLLNSDDTLQYSCRRFPSLLTGVLHAVLSPVWPSNPYTKDYHLASWDHRFSKEVDWVSGACMLLRQVAIREVGFFDERYFMYAEDMDLCYKLKKAKWQVYYLPDAKVVHHIGQSSILSSPKMTVEHHRSIYRFNSKVYKGFPKIILRWLIGLGLLLRAGLLLLVFYIKTAKDSVFSIFSQKAKNKTSQA